MFLKRLEIQGFKSFPEKIRLEFKNGITGVVGPNGSGKSNISDAIRWVLGEQSAKTLRGDKMEDIIFAGTKNRKPLGFAEVSMILDNTDKKLNLDYSEITITRKVYRSGESGYFVNGANCRLKDIYELFMDTGIGKEGYSIIGQGKIDAILSNKIEDRRALFEEAVGIVKFKNRRIQTENRLEEVRKNLTRTNDIIAELERQIKPLENQKEKAKEFLELSKEIKLIRVNLFVEEYKKGEENIKKFDENIELLANDIIILEKQKETYIKKQENLKEDLLKNEKDLEEFNKQFSETNIDIEQKQNDIKLNNQSIDFVKNNIKRIEDETAKNIQEIEKKQAEINFINISLKAKGLELSLKERELESLLKEFEIFTKSMDREEEEIKRNNTEIVEKMRLSSEISNKLAIFNSAKNQYQEKNKETLDQINIYKSKLNEKNTRKNVLEKNFQNIMEEENDNVIKMQDFNKTLQILKNETQTIKTKELENNRKYMELKNKYKILSELEKDHEGYFNSVKTILKEKEQNPKFFGICGAIGELISVPKKYEIAIEISLGGTIQNIVTKTEEDAKIAINYLKETKKGRATFLPITSIKGKKIGEEKPKILQEKGVLGIGDELINFDKEYSQIISSILGRVIIVDNIDNAILLSKKYRAMYKIVTLEGELINAGGALTGGSMAKKSGGIFSRGREIKDIAQNITILEKELANINKEIEEKEKQSLNILENIENLKISLNNIALEKARLTSEISQANEYIEEANENIKNANLDIETLKNQLENNGVDVESLEKKLANINTSIEELKNHTYLYENKMEEEKSNKEDKFNTINKLKMDKKDIEYIIENSQKDIGRLNLEIKNIEQANIYLTTNIGEATKEEQDLKAKIFIVEEEIIKLKEKHSIIKEKYEQLQKEKLDITNIIEKTSAEILGDTTKISDIQNEKTRVENKKENIENKIEALTENMWEEYEITYASASNEFLKLELSYEQLKQEEASFKRKISSLGHINVSAIEEYENVKERYDLNVQQREDIVKADEDLKDIIFKLMEEMESQFKEQFYLINENFGKVFSEIFGGGTASLKLSDEENILTSGIEIVAQPPGKNLQSLTLLSGGERTLTAMSLLFAILRMKPSPFCILDETEAALDDANVTRYANFLKKFSKDNQFILITHKTGTMEIADILYGVTMEEQGVSKVISVELMEAKKY